MKFVDQSVGFQVRGGNRNSVEQNEIMYLLGDALPSLAVIGSIALIVVMPLSAQGDAAMPRWLL